MKPAYLIKIPDKDINAAVHAFVPEYCRQYGVPLIRQIEGDDLVKMQFAMRAGIAAFLRSWL